MIANRRRIGMWAWLVLGGLAAGVLAERQAGADLRDEARQTMQRAAEFYTEKVASHGGYVYYYTPDLQQRWGEGKATPDTIFVQPPGTPAVGMAFLKAHAATGDAFYLDAARAAAEALAFGQLKSGGWTQTIQFGPQPPKAKREGHSSLDDGQTQSALLLLMRVDQTLEFKNTAIHEAAKSGLAALLAAQFPNGAFPQVWTGPVQPQSITRAKFPDYDWRTAGRIKNYWDYYTLNDGLAGTVAETLIAAHQIYRDDETKAAIERLGDFLILAQMPQPQPAWCQQYNFEMVPIWARKFEPPAISGWESQDAMETLIRIARYTGREKYLEPIPPAQKFFEQRLLPDGRVARYYEFQTNKPLFMDKEYRLTYDDSAAPEHYGWKQPQRFAAIEAEYQAARRELAGRGDGTDRAKETDGTDARKPSEGEVRKIIATLDAEGRWVSTYAGERLVGQPKFPGGFRYLSSAVFSRNLETLSAFVAGE